MSTTQIKAKPTAQQPTTNNQQPTTSARENLVQVVQELAATRKILEQAQSEHESTGEELAVLLAKGKSSEKESFDLQAKRAEAKRAVESAQRDVARSLGKASEEVYVGKLTEAEAKLAEVVAKIEEFDLRTQRSATLTRIAELRNQREISEQSVQELQKRARELSNTHAAAIIARSKEGIRGLLETFQDMLAVCELHGPLIAELRNTEPVMYNRLLELLNMTGDDWFLCFQGFPSSDGKIANHRAPLRERQAAVKEQLSKLSSKE